MVGIEHVYAWLLANLYAADTGIRKGLASSVSLSGSSEPDLALVSGGSSKMSAILGFHSHDETAMLVYKTMAN